MRFGSERPGTAAASHSRAALANPTPPHNGVAQRGLPNELGPRYGSERPSSHHFQHAPNFGGASPTKQQQQQQPKFRQSSLSELDEINYNSQQQQQQPPQPGSAANRFDDLYGRVNSNANRHSASHLQLTSSQR